jgi:4-amino-4-deoxy-L-arabinose transferase-like glycosyltransferase
VRRRLRRLVPSSTAAWILIGLLLGALGLRLWSVRYGLPWVYNRDEEFHFVPVAVRFFGGSFNPHYFENPPALTYLLYAVFRLRFHSTGFRHAFAADPTAAYETARVIVALIGTLSVALVYWAGVRWFDRRVGLIAAALVAFGFLPAFYGKFALNDAVTLAPAAVALAALALAWERRQLRWWALAGAAIGVATAVKYTAGAMLLAVAVCALLQVWGDWGGLRARLVALVKIAVVAGVCFGVAFLVLNPYAILDFSAFRHQLANQSATAGGSAKIGQSDTPGWLYYLWSLTWGLGWLPALAAIAGGVLLLRDNWRRGLVLIVFPLFMFVFLGGQARHFGRWFMPAYPAIVLLAGYAAVRIADAFPRRRGWVLAAIGVLLVAQSIASTVRVDAVLARNDTRQLARDWVLKNIPAGAGVVQEPFVPAGWLAKPNRAGEVPYRLYPIKPPFQAYEKKLDAGLIDAYRQQHYCWVIVGSHQKQRGLKADLAGARAYYERLNRESDRTQLFDPWGPESKRPGFNFDMSFDYYPRAFVRPGPLVEVHHIRGCK